MLKTFSSISTYLTNLSKIIFTLILGVTFIITQLNAQAAAPLINKAAVDGTGTAITDVDQGGTVKWVVKINNDTDKILYLKAIENGMSNNQSFTFSAYKDAAHTPLAGANPTVPYWTTLAGIVGAPRWNEIASGNASTTNPLAQDGKWGYEMDGVASPANGTVGALEGHNTNLDINSNGDGYVPEFIVMPDGEKRLLTIYHHQYVSEPYGNFPDGSAGSVPTEIGNPGFKYPNINCYSITTNAVCTGFETGSNGPRTFSSDQPGVGFGVGKTAQEISAWASSFVHKDIATSVRPKNYIDTANGKLYYVAARQVNRLTTQEPNPGGNRAAIFAEPQRQAEVGIACWDYVNNINCGPVSFFKHSDLDFSMWYNTSITGPVMADGLNMVGTKAYFHYVDFDSTNWVVGTPAPIKVGCVDVSNNTVCGTYTYPGVTMEKETYKTTTENVGSKMYFYVDRSKYLSTTGGNQDGIVLCYDAATNAKCTGWTDLLVNTAVDISENGGTCNGTDANATCGSTASLFQLSGLGLCLGNGNNNTGGASVAAYCFDYNGTQIPGISAEFLAQPNTIDAGMDMHGDFNVTLRMPDGTTSERVYLSHDKIINGDTGDRNMIYCYQKVAGNYTKCTDFGTGTPGNYTGVRDFNSCTETRNGVVLGCVPGMNIQYGYTIDPATQCMYGLSHSGELWSFNPFTGSSPCPRAESSTYMNSTNQLYCSGSSAIKSDWKWYARVYNAPVGDIHVKFYDPTGNPDPATAPALANGYVTVQNATAGAMVDLVPASLGRYNKMAIYIVTDEVAVRAKSTYINFSLNFYDTVPGDAPDPEFCFNTTVSNVCDIVSVTNKADLQWALSNYPSTTVPASFATIVSNTATVNVTDGAACNPGKLGDRVWLDTNRDGIQDTGEIGINGVVVNLRNAADNALVSTATTATILGLDGYYLFDPVVAGTYYIEFVLPTGYVFTPQDQVGTEATDSDANTVNGRTADIVMTGPTTNLDLDAGMYLPKIGDYYWDDTDGDGLQDAAELGINGARVNLLDGAGTLIKFTTTANHPTTAVAGWYEFANLAPGNYIVEFTKTAAQLFTVANNATTATDTTDSDADTTTGRTSVIALAAGVDQLTWDGGVYASACLGDRIWLDTNRNGIQDDGELGIANVTITLTLPDGTTRTTTTDANGIYSFCSLPGGSYTIAVTLPNGYVVTLQNQGTDTTDSDINPTGVSDAVVLTPGVDNTSLDGGLYLPRIGDFFWNDKDGDGIQESGEPGLNGIVVNLYQSATPAVVYKTTTTANDSSANPGWYVFNDLLPGTYIVEFVKVATDIYGKLDNAATTDLLDSDADTTTGRTTTITITDADQITWDAGVFTPACLGDRVWLDTDRDGTQDPIEVGIANVTVTLSLPDGTTRTTTTNANGIYSFCGLPEGSYTITVTLPFGYNITVQNQGLNTTDSDINLLGVSDPVVIVQGIDDMSLDAGLFLPRIGDYYWNDKDGDGIQDATEPGLNGVVVNLYQTATPAVVFKTTTTANSPTNAPGWYLFDDLLPGNYIVEFMIPSNYVFGKKDSALTTDLLDSDADIVTGKTTTITITNFDQLYWDAGVFIPACLGDYVWYDKDQDGIQDATEVGMENVAVTLYLPDGDIWHTTTDATGFYKFCRLPEGNYTISFVMPTGYVVTPTDRGTDDAKDNDIDGTFTTPVITITQGIDQYTWDAGFTLLKIGDTAWGDLDKDGLQDVGEIGVPDVRVNLFKWGTTDILETTTTDVNGMYEFDELKTGEYYVQIIPPAGYGVTGQNVGADDKIDSDINISSYLTGKIVLSTWNDFTWDGGLTLGCIGDFVWDDRDGDGKQDPNETGIPNVIVKLILSDGTILTTTTDEFGYYNFCNLKGGNYSVEIDVTQPALVGYPVFHDGFNNTTPIKIYVTLDPGVIYKDADFGFVGKARVGDRVFIDIGKDCIYNEADKGVAGIKLHLKDLDGNILQTTVTDAEGYYYFIVDANQAYKVELDDAWKKNSTIGEATPNCGTTKTSPNLTPGEIYLDLDFGFLPCLPNTGAEIWMNLMAGILMILSSLFLSQYFMNRRTGYSSN